jgi:hypothetical protein
LAGFEEGERALEEDVGCGGPVGLFDVAGGDYTELLVGFVVCAFCDSGGARSAGWKCVGRGRGMYFSCCRAMVFSIFEVAIMQVGVGSGRCESCVGYPGIRCSAVMTHGCSAPRCSLRLDFARRCVTTSTT